MARNQGGGGGGGGRAPQATAPPPAPTPTAPATPPAPTQESSGRVVEPKTALKVAALVLGVALPLLAAKPAYAFMAGINWRSVMPGLVVLGVIGLLALLYWKWRDGFWLLIILGVVGWVVHAMPAPGTAEKPCQPQARKEIVEIREVVVTSGKFHKSGLLWEIGPWQAEMVEFDAPCGVEVWYRDESEGGPHFKIPPGTKGEYYHDGSAHPNGLRLRALSPGTHKVKVIYSRASRQ